MTRPQHEAFRALERVEADVLRAYHWTQDITGKWSHPKAPSLRETYSLRDALAMTRADTLRFGSPS